MPTPGRPPFGAADWARQRALFDELVELDSAGRARRLESLGGQDAALRAALESLLRADAAADVSLGPLESLRSTPDFLGLAGCTFSHFRVHEPLGAGGMGLVYRAEDTVLGRPVALKFLLPVPGADDSERTRLLNEARSAAALDHVNICTVHEVGEDSHGRLFFAMALYSGETLKARIERETRVSVAAAVAIGRQVAEGLRCAHAAGIVHRDLKPANVMLLPDGTVKVLDFGLAMAHDPSLMTESPPAGTPAYMAPEQVMGEPVSARTDLWALGVVLYEMLTGVRPFDDRGNVSVSTAIVSRDPLRLSTARPDIPRALDQLVHSLLARDPEQRVPDAAAVTAALDRMRTDAHERARKGWRPWSIAIIGVTALIVTALVSRAWPRGKAAATTRERSVAVLPFDDLSGTSESMELSADLHDAVITQLTKIERLRPIGRRSVLAYAGSTKPLRQIGEELDVETVLRASVQQVGERVRVSARLVDVTTDRNLWASEFEREGTDLFALEHEIALAIVEALQAQMTPIERQRISVAPTQSAEAYAYYLRGREYRQRSPGSGSAIFSPGPEETRAAQQLFRRAVGIDSTFALAHAELAWIASDPDERRVEATTALRLQPDLPEAHVAMSVYWLSLGDGARALPEMEVARRGLPNDAQIQAYAAGILRRYGRWDEALAGFRRAVRLDPHQPSLAVDLAFTYASLRHYEEAARTWDRAIELAPDNYRFLVEKARVYIRGYGITDSLAAALRRVPPGFDPAGHTTLARVDLEWLRRRPHEALRAFDAIRPEVFTSDDYLNAAWMRMVRAWVYERLADSAAARRDYEMAAALLEGAATRDSGRARLHAVLGIVYAGLGRTAEATRKRVVGCNAFRCLRTHSLAH
ncbi:MAG: protein kinase [Gemmatimonadaceae bacterium]